MASRKESWNTRIGVILAVAGSAVGLGNFLRFPGQAAQHGGGAFMLAYFISLLIIGLPICWAEWTMGRLGGKLGFNSCPGILHAITRHPAAKYLGVIGVVIPIVIYMYYVYIEAWCLGYAINFLRGELDFDQVGDAAGYWGGFIGAGENGSAIGFGWSQVGGYLIFVFILNFVLIYRGLAKGIEWFCKYAMPTMIVLALLILARVLTLGAPDADHPENSVSKGLGYLWNPNKIILEVRISTDSEDSGWRQTALLLPEEYAAMRSAIEADPTRRITETTLLEKIQRPQVWLAAAGQIFFSLSVGFGIILTYSSYLKQNDDVVLSGLAATSANEFCEVAMGGLITVTAGFAFLGIAGVAANSSTFDLGFKVLPLVFSEMPAGGFFGFLFFFLLFLAAVTSSLSMLQPGIAFVEESLDVNRRQSVSILGIITAFGCGFVVYFSEDVKALDTLDFWVGTFLIYILATIQVIIFGWVLGIEEGFKEAHRGAAIRIPVFFGFIIKWVCPAFLLLIFFTWIIKDVLAIGAGEPDYHIRDLIGESANSTAWLSIGVIGMIFLFVTILVAHAKPKWSIHEQTQEER